MATTSPSRRALLAALVAGAVLREQEPGAQPPSPLVLDFGPVSEIVFTFGRDSVRVPVAAILRELRHVQA